MKIHRTVTVVTILGLLASTALLVAFARTAHRSRTSERTRIPVQTVVVHEEAFQDAPTVSGQVEPLRVATVAAEAGERIETRPVQVGDRVRKGAPLAVLDSRNARAALDRARGAAAQATAARRQAEAEYARASVETDAGRQQAQAQLAHAQAQADKTHRITRTQELRQAEAALAQAQVDENLARDEYRRYEGLVRDGLEAEITLDRLKARVDSAEARRRSAEQALSLAREGARREDISSANAQVTSAQAAVRVAETRDVRLAALQEQIAQLRAQEQQAQAAVRQAEIALDKHTVRAPFDGRVLATPVEAGETVAPGTPVCKLGEIRRVKVTCAVAESVRGHLSPEQPVTVRADSLPGQAFRGRVTLVGYQADPRARSFSVEITVDNRDERLLPGMVARLQVATETKASHLVVPLSALAPGDPTAVYVLQDGRSVRRPVTVGRAHGDQVEITEGLHAGEIIAATPQRLTDGAAVEPAR